MIDLFHHVLIDDDQGFVLHSGGRSHVLFDVPGMLYEPEARDFIVEGLMRLMPKHEIVQAIVGIEFGGALLAALIADRWHSTLGRRLDLVFYRPQEKAVAYLPPYDGPAGPAPNVIVLDDVITTGLSMSEASAFVRGRGYNPIEMCVIDRRSR